MTKRHSGLEWLRIISMFMIILLHSIDHSGVLENLVKGTPLYFAEKFIFAAVQVCVNCFVMISGYFLVKSSFKFSKVLSLWVQAAFYAVAIKIVFMATGLIPFSVTSVVSCFFPILTGRYWFVTIYVCLYFIAPFLNIALKAMTKKQHLSLSVILFVLFSVITSIHPAMKGPNSGGGWGLAWFVVLYVWAAYIRLHYKKREKKLVFASLYLVCPIIMTLGLFISEKLEIGIFKSIVSNFWRYDSILVAVSTVSLFLFFLNFKDKEGKGAGRILTLVSASTFGVYLIHAHANICIPEMWQCAGIVQFMDKLWFIPYQVTLVILIFLACSIIDILRTVVFDLLHINKLIDALGKKLDQLVPLNSIL